MNKFRGRWRVFLGRPDLAAINGPLRRLAVSHFAGCTNPFSFLHPGRSQDGQRQCSSPLPRTAAAQEQIGSEGTSRGFAPVCFAKD